MALSHFILERPDQGDVLSQGNGLSRYTDDGDNGGSAGDDSFKDVITEKQFGSAFEYS